MPLAWRPDHQPRLRHSWRTGRRHGPLDGNPAPAPYATVAPGPLRDHAGPPPPSKAPPDLAECVGRPGYHPAPVADRLTRPLINPVLIVTGDLHAPAVWSSGSVVARAVRRLGRGPRVARPGPLRAAALHRDRRRLARSGQRLHRDAGVPARRALQAHRAVTTRGVGGGFTPLVAGPLTSSWHGRAPRRSLPADP